MTLETIVPRSWDTPSHILANRRYTIGMVMVTIRKKIAAGTKIYFSPKNAMSRHIRTSAMPESLHWDSGHKKEWDSWKEWHTDAAKSTGIQKNMEKFDISLDDKPHLREYYNHHKPFYDRMYAQRIGGK